MSGDIGAAADAVTGALAARALEPHDGEGAARGAAHGLCLNCGTGLIGAHCHACGQSGHIHRSIGAIGHEIAHGVFHFEGKIWRTLPMLILHPGDLTRRYVAGERARFVSPLALFLFTVFLMVAVISAVGGEWGEGLGGPDASATRAAINTELDQARRNLGEKEARRAAAVRANADHADLDTDIATLKATTRALGFAANSPSDAKTRPGAITTGWARLDHGIAKARENPRLAIYKLQTSAYKYSWLLIPISTPFVALLFLWRRRFGLYDHAIFVTYSIAFMMLMVIASTLCGAIGLGGGWIALAVLLVPPAHMFAQLRGAYSLRKRSALWRTAALLTFSFAALATFAVLLLIHGLAE